VWSEHPMIHLFPHWNWEGKEGTPITVGCLSNCATVELQLNGRVIVKKAIDPKTVTTFAVPYEKGVLKAVGYSDVGKRLVETTVATAGPAARIALAIDRTVLRADARDLMYVECTVTDRAGIPVPNADQALTFRVEGPAMLIGVENGDQFSHEPAKSNTRKAFHGKCLAVVKSTHEPGVIKFTATADGLETAQIVVTAH
jgi:beta-galactosidase